jgi:hypothetical protein
MSQPDWLKTNGGRHVSLAGPSHPVEGDDGALGREQHEGSTEQYKRRSAYKLMNAR